MKKKIIILSTIISIIIISTIAVVVICSKRSSKEVVSNNVSKDNTNSENEIGVDEVLSYLFRKPKFPIDEIEKQLDLSDDFTYSNYTNLDESFIATYYYKKHSMVSFYFDENRVLYSIYIYTSKETNPNFETKAWEKVDLITYLLTTKNFLGLNILEKNHVIGHIFLPEDSSYSSQSTGKVFVSVISNDNNSFCVSISI